MARISSAQVDDLGRHPEHIHDLSITEMYSIPLDQVAEIQLAALRTRFAAVPHVVATLGRLAEAQKIKEINKIEDGAPLLFPHSLYKSYSASILDTGRFDRLTRWLAGLTSADLSKVDVSHCDTIDDWVDEIDRQTDIRVIHSGGTTGKLSFLPRAALEFQRAVRGFQRYYQAFGDEPNANFNGLADCPIIIPTYRRGAMGHARLMDSLVKYHYNGDEGMVLTLNPGRLSADMLSLAGRLRVAETKGDAGRLQIPAKLLARRDAYLQEQAEAPARRLAFFEDLATRLKGRRVILSGNWVQHYDVAVEALKLGFEKVFAPDSFMFVAGGMKGRDLPADYQDVVKRFLGLDHIGAGYGMSEVTSITPSCPKGHFHLQPFLIPYVLEPKTGAQLPRTGEQTGRYGFIDLMTETYWGGFLTGDEVTINWGDKEPCGCGRIGPYLHGAIRRYSEIEGGDDKVTCAGAPEAHDKALNFLADLA